MCLTYTTYLSTSIQDQTDDSKTYHINKNIHWVNFWLFSINLTGAYIITSQKHLTICQEQDWPVRRGWTVCLDTTWLSRGSILALRISSAAAWGSLIFVIPVVQWYIYWCATVTTRQQNIFKFLWRSKPSSNSYPISKGRAGEPPE